MQTSSRAKDRQVREDQWRQHVEQFRDLVRQFYELTKTIEGASDPHKRNQMISSARRLAQEGKELVLRAREGMGVPPENFNLTGRRPHSWRQIKLDS